MNCNIQYHRDKRYNKPWSIAAVLVDDEGDVFATLDVHERWLDKRDAHAVGKSIGVRFDAFSESWGDLQMLDAPPAINTELD